MTATDSSRSDASDGGDWSYAAGDLLADRYRITERLARGAFGEVHAAEDTTTDQRVALKVLRGDSHQRDPKAVARMRQEAELLRAIDHPNLVQVHDIIVDQEQEFLVMELLEGDSLRDVIDEGRLGEPDRVRAVVEQILSALEAMHARGVQHRDIKPDNIFLLSHEDDQLQDLVKLVDLGIAKAQNFVDSDQEFTLVETQNDEFVGTPRYAAPEQAVGDPVGETADLFSLGLVVAEWFTGEPRISTSGHRGVISVLIQPTPLDVSDCPADWQDWLATMIAKTPDERFPSAADARLALPGSDDTSLILERTLGLAAGEIGDTTQQDETPPDPSVGEPGDPLEPTAVRSGPPPAAADASGPHEAQTTPGPAANAPPAQTTAPGQAPPNQPGPHPTEAMRTDDPGSDVATVPEDSQPAAGAGSPDRSALMTLAAALFFVVSLGIFLWTIFG